MWVVAAGIGGIRVRSRHSRSRTDSRRGRGCSPWRFDVVKDEFTGGLEVVEDELLVARRLQVIEGKDGAGGGNDEVTS